MNGSELANTVEQAQLKDYKEAGKAGLEALTKEFNEDQFKNFDNSRFDDETDYKNAVLRGALANLRNDGALLETNIR